MYSNEVTNEVTIDTLNDELNQFLSRPNRFVPIDVVYDRLGLNYNEQFNHGRHYKMTKELLNRMLNARPVYLSALTDALGINGWCSDENGNSHRIDLKDWNYNLLDVIQIAQKLLNCEWLE
jgi:hypothetical protein